ncbi:hypothetical protein BVG80_16075 [Sphingobacteriales bacterium TSM_CSM]|nr:hypothetical protein BVG80_16075 [Sphingobacteriales bacterium TSM_CSM]
MQAKYREAIHFLGRGKQGLYLLSSKVVFVCHIANNREGYFLILPYIYMQIAGLACSSAVFLPQNGI